MLSSRMFADDVISFVSSEFTDVIIFFFFFQAEDGIRDDLVTGVQTCALPIFLVRSVRRQPRVPRPRVRRRYGGVARRRRGPFVLRLLSPRWARRGRAVHEQIGRASCRERVEMAVGDECVKGKIREDLGGATAA